MVEEKHYVPTPAPMPAPELSDLDKELEAQKEDWKKAVEAEKNAAEKMAALPEQYHDVFEATGIGPVYEETKRGFIRINPGDVVVHFEFVDGDTGLTEKETVVMSHAALDALETLVQAPVDDIPLGLEARAARITAKRHADALPKPKVEPPKATVLPAKK